MDQSEFNKNLAMNLRKARKNMRLTQKTISKLLGVSNSAYSNYENGHRLPSIHMLYSFSKLLNISINELCRDFNDDEELHNLQMELIYSFIDYLYKKNFKI